MIENKEDLEELEETEEYEDEEEEERKPKRKLRLDRILLIIIIILLLLLGSCGVMYKRKSDSCGSSKPNTPLEIDKSQGDFQAEEVADRHVKNVTLPGWGSFNIPANKTTIDKGFEFHNPESNKWFRDTVKIGDLEVESFVVGDDVVEVGHLLRLADIDSAVKGVKSYDKDYFEIDKDADGKVTIKGVKGFDGIKEVSVETEDGQTVSLSISSKEDFYYMTFGLYIDNAGDEEDELLYQSDLVEPGKYIQTITLSRSIPAGSYDAYVVCQPYKSDAATPTNNGIVKIKLNAK